MRPPDPHHQARPPPENGRPCGWSEETIVRPGATWAVAVPETPAQLAPQGPPPLNSRHHIMRKEQAETRSKVAPYQAKTSGSLRAKLDRR